DRHHAVVHADHDAREIGVRKNRNGNAERQIAADQREANDQEKNRAGDFVKPEGWSFRRHAGRRGRRIRVRHGDYSFSEPDEDFFWPKSLSSVVSVRAGASILILVLSGML